MRLRHAVGVSIVVLLCAVGLRLVTEAYSVTSSSMAPTLLPGDHVLVTPYLTATPGLRDIVVFEGGSDTTIVKRVIGLSGDSVQIIGGKVLINGLALDEEFYAHSAQGSGDSVHIVPKGHLFLLGDNRDASTDSRVFGFVPRNAVVGRARFIYWSTSSPETGGSTRWHRLFKVIH